VRRLPKRKPETHKGDYGKVLVVAGSPGMCGAATLASQAAYRSGAGLVYIACPASVAPILSAKQDCAVVWPFEEKTAADQLFAYAARCDAAVIGPGLSQAPAIVEAIRELVGGIEIPFVLDADGLNAFVDHPDLLARGKGTRILTPHPGEASRILKKETAEIQADRKAAALEIAKRFLAVTVLKGHGTVVTDGSKTFVNRTGNPGMATGGTGDVLSGVIGALLGQKMEPYPAACLGVEVHGKAGDFAARKYGEVSLMATDLLEFLPRAFGAKGK
jgi:NAD(P)H-hydrate epimerase